MGFAFNPFTGNFDAKGSGGGGGASYIDGEVAVYADLSLDAGVAPLNSAWLVREASGIWPVSRKQAGIYIRTATAGSSRDADYTYAGTMPDVFSDANFVLYDNGDSTKNLQFQLSGISTGTTRTLTVPNASGTLGWLQSVSSITVSTDHQLTAARNQRVRVNSTNITSGAFVYLPATNNAEGDRLEVACVGLTSGLLTVQTGQYDFTVSASMGLNEQRTFMYTAGAWTVGTVESHTHAGLGPTFASSAFQVTEPSGIVTNRLAFSLSGLTAGATRTLTVPNASGTIALTSNFAAPPAIGNTTPNTVAATDLSASNKLSLPSAAAASPTAGDLYRNANTIRYRDGTNTERLLLNATDNLSNLANTATARTNIGLGSANNVTFGSIQDTPIGSTTPAAGSFTTLNATGTTELVNGGTTAGPFRVYNTSSSANANFERGFMRWSSNVLQIGTEKGGTGSARALEFQTDGTTRCSISTTGVFSILGTGGSATQTYSQPFFGRLSYSITPANNLSEVKFASAGATAGNGRTYFIIGSTDGSGNTGNNLLFGISNGRAFLTNAVDFITPSVLHLGGQGWGADGVLTLDGVVAGNAGVMVMRGLFEQRNGTSAQTFRIYNTVSGTNNVNFDRVNFRWASNEFIIDAEAGGTGTLRGIKIGSATSSLLGFYGVTPVDQPATVADPAGGGTVDTEARTAINAIIDRLQELGLIA